MCGIFGFVTKNSNNNAQTKDILKVCTDVITHRGPDDVAYYSDALCSLGMRRLSILDLTPGLYPFSNEKAVVIFNGEIYNFKKLREQLISFGYSFKSDCDGEVILHGYTKWGIKVFEKLQGMFAIAIWDKKLQKLIIARDRVGIKPLYYFEYDGNFCFSSEVKALLKLKDFGISFDLNYDMVKKLVGFMFLPDSRNTIIQGIKKVLPGTIIEITKSKVRETRYWDVKDIKVQSNLSFKDACAELENLLIKTVGEHLISDVPIGVMLSGGLDSSLLTAIIAKHKMLGKINTYTAKFDHPFNESSSAQTFAKELGTKHHEILIDVSKVNRDIEKYVDTYDDLSTFDGGLITTKILCNEIEKDGIKVLLLGEGADEVFGGYSWFGLSKLPFNIIPQFLRSVIYYYAISRNITHNFLYYAKEWNKLMEKSENIFNQISTSELSFQLPNHLLMKVDKATMAESLEARVPYLDHKIVEYAYSLPPKYKINGSFINLNKSNEKYILREIAKKYLPESLVNRKKRGFMLPMSDVIESDITKVKDYVLNASGVSTGIMDMDFKERLFIKTRNKFVNMQKEYFIWRLFLLEVWATKNQII